MAPLGKALMGLGALLLVVGGLLWYAADHLPWLGRLPGDIRIERPGVRLYAPLTTMLLLSVLLSLVMWCVQRFFR